MLKALGENSFNGGLLNPNMYTDKYQNGQRDVAIILKYIAVTVFSFGVSRATRYSSPEEWERFPKGALPPRPPPPQLLCCLVCAQSSHVNWDDSRS